jgi:hypothetical protein
MPSAVPKSRIFSILIPSYYGIIQNIPGADAVGAISRPSDLPKCASAATRFLGRFADTFSHTKKYWPARLRKPVHSKSSN